MHRINNAVTTRGATLAAMIIVLVMGLGGCQAYKDGSSRTMGQVTDDARIQTAVKAALIRDEQIAGFPMNVDVHRGVVSLYGRVSSEAVRAKAIGIAGSIRGVVEVKDRLTLVPPG